MMMMMMLGWWSVPGLCIQTNQPTAHKPIKHAREWSLCVLYIRWSFVLSSDEGHSQSPRSKHILSLYTSTSLTLSRSLSVCVCVWVYGCGCVGVCRASFNLFSITCYLCESWWSIHCKASMFDVINPSSSSLMIINWSSLLIIIIDQFWLLTIVMICVNKLQIINGKCHPKILQRTKKYIDLDNGLCVFVCVCVFGVCVFVWISSKFDYLITNHLFLLLLYTDLHTQIFDLFKLCCL